MEQFRAQGVMAGWHSGRGSSAGDRAVTLPPPSALQAEFGSADPSIRTNLIHYYHHLCKGVFWVVRVWWALQALVTGKFGSAAVRCTKRQCNPVSMLKQTYVQMHPSKIDGDPKPIPKSQCPPIPSTLLWHSIRYRLNTTKTFKTGPIKTDTKGVHFGYWGPGK